MFPIQMGKIPLYKGKMVLSNLNGAVCVDRDDEHLDHETSK